MAGTEESLVRFSPFSQRNLSESSIVSIDHSYAKPWSSHPDASSAQPVRMLFMDQFARQTCQAKESDDSETIDVEGDRDSKLPLYDQDMARRLMMEGETLGASLCSDQSDMEDWEEHMSNMRDTWSVLQNRLFAKVMRILQADRLARLTIQGSSNEPIQRRLQVDKAAKRVRQAFANVSWDMTLILWLHNLFLDNLRGQLFVSYLEILQTLKAKIPSLTDKLLAGTTSRPDIISSEALSAFLKKSWDPVMSSISHQKLKKLPEHPVLLVLPSAPSLTPNPLGSKRHKFWHTQLLSMGKVINVVPINTSTSVSIASCVDSMISTAKAKIAEVKCHYPGRPVILIGWEVGAVVACHVSQMELVQGVVCLGFPTTGISGHRWDIEDQMYQVKTPSLFVVGQHATNNSLDMLEEIREKLQVETGLVVVGGADSSLRMGRAKKKSCSVTQAVVDRCILEEMFDFLVRVLSQQCVQADQMMEQVIVEGKKQRKRKHKDLFEDGQTMTIKKQASSKLAKGFTLADSDSLLGGQVKGMKTGKKLGKKRVNKMADPSLFQNKPELQLATSTQASSSDSSSRPAENASSSPAITSITTTSEAAAIASAPELSNLLQTLKPSEPSLSASVTLAKVASSQTSNINSPPGLASSSIPTTATVATTTALTLSRFLASSGFLKNTMSFKPEDDLGISLGSDFYDILSSGSGEKTSPKQSPQFMLSTGTDSLSSQLSSKMARPLGKLSGSSSQIEQLLTGSVRGSSSSAFSPSFKAGQTPGGTVTHSPGASVINIDSDTVFMKEGPPSSSPAPGTVSIDLGEIATPSSVTNTSGLLKLSSGPPRVSLIPMGSPVHSSISTTASSSAFLSQPSITPHNLSQPSTTSHSLSQPSVNSLSLSQPSTTPHSWSKAIITSQAGTTMQSLSGTTSHTFTQLSPSISTTSTSRPTNYPAKVVQMVSTANRGLVTMTSSQRGMSQSHRQPSPHVALQVSTSKESPGGPIIMGLARDEPDGMVRQTPPHTKPQVRVTYTAMVTKSVTTSSSTVSTLKSSEASAEPKAQPTLSKFSTADLASLIMNSGSGRLTTSPALGSSKPSTSAGQMGTQLKVLSTSSSTSSSIQSVKPSGVSASSVSPVKTSLSSVKPLLSSVKSPITSVKPPLSSMKTSSPLISTVSSIKPSVLSPSKASMSSIKPMVVMVSSSSETLGKVSSLLESSPITTGEVKKSSPATTTSSTSSTTISSTTSSSTSTLSTPTTKQSVSQSPNSSPLSPPARASKQGASSYTAKPVLPTVASTRTRRIKTPKQYDL